MQILITKTIIIYFIRGSNYGRIREQAVIIRFRESFILICGCCHPGLTIFLKQRESLGIDKEMPFHILGGMHGFRFSDKQAVELKSKIKLIILCHCTQNVNVFKKQSDDKCELGILGKEYRFE